VRLACERAAFTGTDVGFALVEDGLRFGRLAAGRWVPVEDSPAEALRQRPLGTGTTVVAFRDGLPLAADGLRRSRRSSPASPAAS
jgi:hypothetical protein